MLKKDMNLLESYRLIQKARKERTTPSVLYAGIIFLVALLMTTYSLKVFFDNASLERKIESIEVYINDPLVIKKLNEISIMQENIKQLDTLKAEVTTIIGVLDYIPRFDQDILKILFDNLPEGIRITKVSYINSWISLEISGPYPSDSSNYALRLQRTGFFKDVIYDGYRYDEGQKRYRGTMKIQLKGGN
jgi:hypothetical protein